MSNLPKRGDRVRVTEFRGDGRPYRGIHNEVALVSDAEDAGDGFISFDYQTMKGKPARVNAVKVEILERANSCPTCRDSPAFDARCPCPTCGGPGRPDIVIAEPIHVDAVDLLAELEAK